MNPTTGQLAARLSPTATSISIPTGGLYRAVGDSGDAVYAFDEQGVPTAYQLAQQGQPVNNYGANLAALSGYGVDWNSLPTFNKADIDQRLARMGKLGPNGMPIYNSGGGLSDLATLRGVPATSTSQTLNGTMNTVATPAQVAQQQQSSGWVSPPAPAATGTTGTPQTAPTATQTPAMG